LSVQKFVLMSRCSKCHQVKGKNQNKDFKHLVHCLSCKDVLSSPCPSKLEEHFSYYQEHHGRKIGKEKQKHKFSEADIPEDSKAVLAEGVGSGQLEYADIRNRLINVRSTKGSQARAGVLTSHTPPSESPSTSVKQDSNWYASECDVLIELRQYISDQMVRSPESRHQSQQTFVANMKLDLKRGETLCEELDILAKSRQFNRCISKNEELEDWCFRVKRNLHNENNQPNNKRKSPSPPPEQYHENLQYRSRRVSCPSHLPLVPPPWILATFLPTWRHT